MRADATSPAGGSRLNPEGTTSRSEPATVSSDVEPPSVRPHSGTDVSTRGPDPESLRPSHLPSPVRKELAGERVDNTCGTPPYLVSLKVDHNRIHAQISHDDDALTEIPLGYAEDPLSEADLLALNERFKSLSCAQLEHVITRFSTALKDLEHVGREQTKDPIVPTGMVTRAAKKQGKHREEIAHLTESKARRASTAVESVGHVIAPPAMVGVAELLHSVHDSSAAAALGTSLHVASEGLHAAVGVLDIYMLARGLKEGAPKWQIALHGARAVASLGSLFVPLLTIVVIALTAVKLTADFGAARNARHNLNAAKGDVASSLRTLVDEMRAEHARNAQSPALEPPPEQPPDLEAAPTDPTPAPAPDTVPTGDAPPPSAG